MYRGYFFAENARKIEENEWNIGEFPRNSFLNLLPDDPFSRSFSVVFGRFCGHFWRKSENIGGIFPFSFHFFPLHYTFIPQTPHFYALQHI